MSKVNIESAQSNFERIITDINELQQIISSLKEEISKTTSEGKEVIDTLMNRAVEMSSVLLSKEEKKQQLREKTNLDTTSFQELTHKKDVLLSEIQSKKQDLEQLSNIIMNKEQQKTDINTQIIAKEGRIEGHQRKIEENQVLIDVTKEETINNLKTRTDTKTKTVSDYEKIVSRSKALKFLIKKNIVNLPEITVIRSITVPGVDTEENIRKTSGVSDQIVRKILLDLDSREIISFEPLSGRIQKLTEIDL